MAVTGSNPHGPLDPRRLAAFEGRVGVSLPAEYREFLVAHNGGTLAPEDIILPGQAEPFTLLSGPTFGLHGGDGDLGVVYDSCHGVLPADLIAFAEDHGGNLLCIGVHGSSAGKVYFWDHNRSRPGDDAPGWEGVTFLAGSFGLFVAHLGRPQPGEPRRSR